MATIKSYTGLEQSKKLAEFLPLESADFQSKTIESNADADVDDVSYVIHPCWSLAALLSVLPRVNIEKEISSDDTYNYRIKAYIRDGYIGDWYDNPVDACVELILKLHELNLL